MRKAPTQDLTDGELFYIIENGVRLTGMPAWGDGSPQGETLTWQLVHFIRRMPKLTPEEIRETAETCVALLETQGKSIDVTLSEISSEGGGWLLPEDAPRVREAALVLLSERSERR